MHALCGVRTDACIGRKAPQHARAHICCWVQAVFLVEFKRLVYGNSASRSWGTTGPVVRNVLGDWRDRLPCGQRFAQVAGRPDQSCIHLCYQAPRQLFPAVGYATSLAWVGLASSWRPSFVLLSCTAGCV